MAGDWREGNLDVVAGAPRYRHDYEHEALKRAADIFRRQYQPLGASEDQRKAVQNEIERLKKSVRVPKGADIDVYIPGADHPVKFTPNEVWRTARDENFARSILSSATGIPDINPVDLRTFQNQLLIEHPEVMREGNAGRLQTYGDETVAEFQDRLRADRLAEFTGRVRSEAAQREVPPDVLPATPQIPDDQQLRGTLAQWGRSGWIGNDILPQYEQQKKEILEGKRDKFEISGLGRGGSGEDLFTNMLPQLLNYRQRLSAHPAELETAKQRYYDQAIQPQLAEYHQHEREIANDPELSRQDKKLALEALEKSVSGRVGLQRAEEAQRAKLGLIAPMNQYHEEANRLLRETIGKEAPHLQGMQRNIAQLEGSNIPRTVDPFLNEASRHASEFAHRYENPHQDAYIQSLRDRMVEDFENRILPAVNARVPITDGARQAILNKYAQNMQKDLAHKVLEMRERNYQNALSHGEQHRNTMMSGAQVAGNAENLQNISRLQAAEALRNQAFTEQAIRQHQMQGLSGVASQKQQQAQNEINTRVQEQARAQQFPREQIQAETAIAHNLPPTTSFTHQLAQAPLPQPPHPMQWGASSLGALYQAFNPHHQQQQPPHMRGYAQGGQVSDYQNQLQSHDAKMREMEGRMENMPFDRAGNIIENLGAYALSSPRPYEAVSNAMQQSKKDSLAHMYNQHNLYDKIMQSRQEQKKVLMDYQARKDDRDSSRTQHLENLSEKKRYHDLKIASDKEKAAHQPLKLTRADQNLITEANKEMDATNYIEDRLDELDAIISKVDTGHPSIASGLLKEPMWQAFYGIGKQADIEKINMLTNDIVNEGTKKFGRGAGIGMRNALATAKMGIQYRTDTNKAAIARIRKDLGKLRNKYGHMFDALDNDNIPPSKSISHHYSKRVNKKDGEPNGNAFSPNREEENQFQGSDEMPSQESEREALQKEYDKWTQKVEHARGS